MGKAKRNVVKRPNLEPKGSASVNARDLRELELEVEGHMDASRASGSVTDSVSQPCCSGLSDSGDQTNAIVNIIRKLQSSSADERECTCLTIISLIGQPDAIPRFFHAGLVRIAGPLLVDESVGVRQAALGVLRNMTVDGGSEICALMVEEDIMTYLVALLQKFGVEWTTDGQNKQDAEVFHQALHLMWNLCEASPAAVEIVNQQNLLPVFLPCLLPNCHGYSIAVTAAQCVYTITEDNMEASILLSKPDVLYQLNSLFNAQCHNNAEQMLHKLLIAGILYNISHGEMSSLGSDVLNQVLNLLGATLQHDVHVQLECIAQFIRTLDIEEPLGAVSGQRHQEQHVVTTEGAAAKCTQNLPDGDVMMSMIVEGANTEEDDDDETNSLHDSIFEIKHRKLDEMMLETRTLITAQQLAVEMVANFCSSGDDNGLEGSDISDSGSDDRSSDNGDDVMDDQSIEDDLPSLPSEIQKSFITSGLITKVFQKLKVVDVGICQLLSANSQSKSLHICYEHLQLRSLLCTSNLIDAVDVEDLGGASALHELWVMLSGLTQTTATNQCLDFLEAATTALRAVADKLDEIDSPELQQIQESDLQFLFNLGTQCSHCQVRANAIRITCTIGSALIQHDNSDKLKEIGEFLCHVVTADQELWVVAEALDAMFDVFAEDKTDSILKQLGLVAKLQKLVPVLKKKVQEQKKHLGEHYPIICTAKTNLIRFIKYKASRPTAV